MTEQIKIHHNCQIQNTMRLHACSYLILHILYVYWFVFLVIALQEVTCSVNEIIYLFLDLFLAFLPLLYSNSQRDREKEDDNCSRDSARTQQMSNMSTPPPPPPWFRCFKATQALLWVVRMRISCLKALLPQRTKLAAIEVYCCCTSHCCKSCLTENSLTPAFYYHTLIHRVALRTKN